MARESHETKLQMNLQTPPNGLAESKTYQKGSPILGNDSLEKVPKTAYRQNKGNGHWVLEAHFYTPMLKVHNASMGGAQGRPPRSMLVRCNPISVEAPSALQLLADGALKEGLSLLTVSKLHQLIERCQQQGATILKNTGRKAEKIAKLLAYPQLDTVITEWLNTQPPEAWESRAEPVRLFFLGSLRGAIAQAACHLLCAAGIHHCRPVKEAPASVHHHPSGTCAEDNPCLYHQVFGSLRTPGLIEVYVPPIIHTDTPNNTSQNTNKSNSQHPKANNGNSSTETSKIESMCQQQNEELEDIQGVTINRMYVSSHNRHVIYDDIGNPSLAFVEEYLSGTFTLRIEFRHKPTPIQFGLVVASLLAINGQATGKAKAWGSGRLHLQHLQYYHETLQYHLQSQGPGFRVVTHPQKDPNPQMLEDALATFHQWINNNGKEETKQ
ncbi:MAG: hypothetical protein ACFFDP_01290 [Promethearchaeota archaeon]